MLVARVARVARVGACGACGPLFWERSPFTLSIRYRFLPDVNERYQ